MSTRCQIGFYEKDEQDLSKWEALLYRHSDGYPGKEDGSEYGVLADIVPFLKWWNNNRGIADLEYCSARLLQHLCNQYDKEMSESEIKHQNAVVSERLRFTGILGHGICKIFHGDIEYFYAIYPDRLEVYKVPYDENWQSWKKIRTIRLAEKA